MYLAKVVGTVVSTQKAEGLAGVRLLVIEPTDETGKAVGTRQVAVDAVQAGEGELVYVCTGREASLALDDQFVPVDLAVVAHVDDVDVTAKTETRSDARAAGVRRKGRA